MARLPVAMMVVGLLCSSARADDADWFVYEDPDGAFTMTVPGTPSVSHEVSRTGDGAELPMIEYIVDRGDHAMAVMVSRLPSNTGASSGEVVDGAVAGVKARAADVISDTIETVDGQVGRNVRVRNDAGGTIEQRVYFVGGRLYQIISVRAAGADPGTRDELSRFHDGFHFTSVHS